MRLEPSDEEWVAAEAATSKAAKKFYEDEQRQKREAYRCDLRDAYQMAKALLYMYRVDRRVPVLTKRTIRVLRYMLGVHVKSGVLPKDFEARAERCGLIPETDATKFAQSFREAETILHDRKVMRLLKHVQHLPGSPMVTKGVIPSMPHKSYWEQLQEQRRRRRENGT